jgi:hypothetical protein
MVSFSDLLCRVKGTAEERNSKYDNMGCQVFKRGIQNWKKFGQKLVSSEETIVFLA